MEESGIVKSEDLNSIQIISNKNNPGFYSAISFAIASDFMYCQFPVYGVRSKQLKSLYSVHLNEKLLTECTSLELDLANQVAECIADLTYPKFQVMCITASLLVSLLALPVLLMHGTRADFGQAFLLYLIIIIALSFVSYCVTLYRTNRFSLVLKSHCNLHGKDAVRHFLEICSKCDTGYRVQYISSVRQRLEAK